MKEDKKGMNIAWAYSLNTVQFIDDVIYGATVLGGNILKTEIDGTSKIIWENDYTDPHKSGIFLSSLLYCGKLYLFPYMSEYIVIYDINMQTVEKIRFGDKGREETIYPRLFENKILMFGLDTGRVWELGTSITPLGDVNSGAGKLHKYRSYSEGRYMLFYGAEKKLAPVFDCKKPGWINIDTSDFIKGGFADDNLLWYADGDKFYCQHIDSKSRKEIISISEGTSAVSVVPIDDKRLLVVEYEGNGIYLIDKETKNAEKTEIDFFTEKNHHVAIELGGNRLLYVDCESLDWMLWSGDRYAICNTLDMSVTDIPIFNMDSKDGRMINERYARIAWKLAPNKTIYESEKEGLDFFLKSISLGVFD